MCLYWEIWDGFETQLDRDNKYGGGNLGAAVFYLDLDNFKDVNDTLFYPTGDRVLQSEASDTLGTLSRSR